MDSRRAVPKQPS